MIIHSRPDWSIMPRVGVIEKLGWAVVVAVCVLMTLAMLTGCEQSNLEPGGSRDVKVLDLTAAGATVSGLSLGLRVGQTLQLYAQPKDASGNPIPDAVITWSSSPPTVATVSISGLVTAVAPGTATISATSGTVVASLTLAVLSTPVFSVAVTPAVASVTVGQSVQLLAQVRDSLGNVLINQKAVWISSAPAAASVDSTGLVKGVATGSAIVTATAGGRSGTSTVTVTAVIKPPPVSGALFQDDFESGGCSCWVKSSGAWTVVTSGTGHVFNQATVGGSFAWVTPPSGSVWADYSVQAEVRPGTWGSSDATARLSGRVSGTGSFYTASLEQTAIRLRRFVNGAITDLVAAKAYKTTTGATYKVKLTMIGSRLSVYVNDTLYLTATDTLYKSGGVALGGWNTTGQWDNVVVSSLASTTISGLITVLAKPTLARGDSSLVCIFFQFATGQVAIGTQDHPTCDALYAGLKLTSVQTAVTLAQQAVVDDSVCVDATATSGIITGDISIPCGPTASAKRKPYVFQVAISRGVT